MTRFWVPVRSSSTEANWPGKPILSRTFSGWRKTSNPLTRAVPESGHSSVARILMAVVFPAPFGPRTACTVPRRAARSTPASALVSAKDFVSPVASITRSVMLPGWEGVLAAGAHPAVTRPGAAVTGLTARWWDNRGMVKLHSPGGDDPPATPRKNRLGTATSPYLLQH